MKDCSQHACGNVGAWGTVSVGKRLPGRYKKRSAWENEKEQCVKGAQ